MAPTPTARVRRITLMLSHLPMADCRPMVTAAVADPADDDRWMAAFASGDAKTIPFPLTPIKPIPFHAFRQVGVAAAITWYRLLDALER